jgi:putative sterol carrier protein
MVRVIRICATLMIFLSANNVIATQDVEARREALQASSAGDSLKYQMEYALAALQNGRLESARTNFDAAIADIESFFSHEDNALKARSLWYEEGKKTFKGEPYERAMAYYYRGLLHIFDGEIDNARAAFLSGQLQDAFAEEDQHRTDFALLMLLEAWMALSMGAPDLANAALQDFSVLRAISIPRPDTHALVIVETGKSPRKLRDGISGEKLVYRRGKKFKDKYATVTAQDGNYTLDLLPVEDIYYQATTRGSRWIDSVNEGKAVYKDAISTRGMTVANLSNQLNLINNLARDYENALSDSGASTVNLSLGVNFGALTIGASAISMISSRIKPKSDDRYWDNLPDNVNVGFIPLEVVDTEDSVRVSLYDIRGQLIRNDEIVLTRVANGGTFAWYKAH